MNKLLLSLATLVALAGCSSAGGVGHGLYMKKMGKEKVVEKSGSKPDWVKRGSVFIKHGVLYAVGSLTDSPNLSMGMRVAHKRAQAILVESMKEHLQTTFREAAEGLNINQLDVQTMTFSTAEAVVTGFFPSDQYSEKKESLGMSGTAYKYDCYALTEITQENYMKALDGVLNGYQNKGISEAFRNKVDAREEEFFQKDRAMNGTTIAPSPTASATPEKL